MINKKAQAAMEFLMTYGWAILIVLVVLAALFFLGIFNPATPNTCLISAPFNCQDVKVSAASTDNMIIGVSGVSSASVVVSGGCTVSSALTNGQTSTLTLTCTGATAGQKVSGAITGTYILAGSTLSHTIAGTYSATVEA